MAIEMNLARRNVTPETQRNFAILLTIDFSCWEKLYLLNMPTETLHRKSASKTIVSLGIFT